MGDTFFERVCKRFIGLDYGTVGYILRIAHKTIEFFILYRFQPIAQCPVAIVEFILMIKKIVFTHLVRLQCGHLLQLFVKLELRKVVVLSFNIRIPKDGSIQQVEFYKQLRYPLLQGRNQKEGIRIMPYVVIRLFLAENHTICVLNVKMLLYPSNLIASLASFFQNP